MTKHSSCEAGDYKRRPLHCQQTPGGVQSCLEAFLRNLILNEDHPLHNRTLHISGAFKDAKNPDIDAKKPDIDTLKAYIETIFQPKTISHILKLREAFPGQAILDGQMW